MLSTGEVYIPLPSHRASFTPNMLILYRVNCCSNCKMVALSFEGFSLLSRKVRTLVWWWVCHLIAFLTWTTDAFCSRSYWVPSLRGSKMIYLKAQTSKIFVRLGPVGSESKSLWTNRCYWSIVGLFKIFINVFCFLSILI